jgi:hypothetical protein
MIVESRIITCAAVKREHTVFTMGSRNGVFRFFETNSTVVTAPLRQVIMFSRRIWVIEDLEGIFESEGKSRWRPCVFIPCLIGEHSAIGWQLAIFPTE